MRKINFEELCNGASIVGLAGSGAFPSPTSALSSPSSACHQLTGRAWYERILKQICAAAAENQAWKNLGRKDVGGLRILRRMVEDVVMLTRMGLGQVDDQLTAALFTGFSLPNLSAINVVKSFWKTT